LVKLGKKLKKNNVAVDIVLFGDEGMSNEGVLSKFVDATQNSENWYVYAWSRLVFNRTS